MLTILLVILIILLFGGYGYGRTNPDWGYGNPSGIVGLLLLILLILIILRVVPL